ncbi:uncharacterized protein EHS24_002496 [Apiotrichum porosum]|uniref:37S ribosomal protein mrp10, mitochondrial n=1 Tax=Apiotrichum porosum TaxID=105984 RepID=A0A427XGL6_9TREE|nr:uncharacterized protein EHS24_002496 [Apiotrichum porosum]RSH78041.1 hypothetical protein EHS24_002496 [Apiotrichum porosum]
MAATRFKVRPTKKVLNIACAPEFSAMLACFASTGDLRHQNVGTAGCADAAKALHACMAKPRNVRAARVPSINHVLSKVK